MPGQLRGEPTAIVRVGREFMKERKDVAAAEAVGDELTAAGEPSGFASRTTSPGGSGASAVD